VVTQSKLLLDTTTDANGVQKKVVKDGTRALSCHVRIADIPTSASEHILHAVQDRLRKRFHIYHSTIQCEHVNCEIGSNGCCIQPVVPHSHQD
jgi:cobalt-zinc-cadmium efflux system protein